VVLGPAVLAVTEEAEEIRTFAELGVVFLLFLIGLELKPTRLWQMRRDIFGLGALQVVLCGAVLMLYPLLIVGRPWPVALIAGLGLALSSTALVMQIIEERQAMRLPYGQKTFAVLLMQDLAIVPLLALVTLLAPGQGDGMTAGALALSALQAVGAVAIIVLVGHYLLSPAFRLLARFGGHEIMIAAALLIVLGAGTAMVAVGLSMAMGAFLAGVLLAESNYRHELEADIEPFRSLLLGLFFLSVGMSLDFPLIAANIGIIAGGVVTLIIAKTAMVYGLVRLFGNDHPTALKTGVLLSQGGEFGFVLFTTAAAQGVMTMEDANLLSATVIISMVTTPFIVRLLPLVVRPKPKAAPENDFTEAHGDVLIVGFGRFGQLVSQMLLAGGFKPILLDNDAERVTEARRFGNRVFYGDGRRLDLLRAAGAEKAAMICICTTPADVTTAIVDLCKKEFPEAFVFARAYDRRHALTLFDHAVDYQRRETLDSAIRFGRDALLALGLEADDAKESEILVRKRDRERLDFQRLEGLAEGHARWREVTPEPFTRVRTEDDAVNPEDRAEAAE
jgi:monovalent cation:proton antiporter-2 (CPA2) family protein